MKGIQIMRLRFGLILLFMLPGIISCTSSRESEPVKPGKVLVTVNGVPITSEEVERRKRALFGVVDISQADPTMVSRMTEEATDAEIMDLLLLQAARGVGIATDQSQIDVEVKRTREMMGDENFLKMLKDRGVKDEGFRDFVSDRLLIRTFREQLIENVTVEETVLEEYFEGHRDRFQNPDGVRLHIMVVDDEAMAASMYEKMVAGESFPTIADSYRESGGKVSRTRWMPYDVLPDGIRQLVLANTADEIIRHQDESGKVYLIKILEKREAAFMEFDEAGEMVRSVLLQNRRQRVLDNWYEKQIKTATIEYVKDHGLEKSNK
jgi:parvulin-like peptidyl-prolyl isomerase